MYILNKKWWPNEDNSKLFFIVSCVFFSAREETGHRMLKAQRIRKIRVGILDKATSVKKI